MTATVTEVTRTSILSNNYASILTTLNLIVILLLVIMLTQKELIRALGSDHLRAWMRALDIGIIPLLISFSLIILTRIIDLLASS
jgi:hypothetical protein